MGATDNPCLCSGALQTTLGGSGGERGSPNRQRGAAYLALVPGARETEKENRERKQSEKTERENRGNERGEEIKKRRQMRGYRKECEKRLVKITARVCEIVRKNNRLGERAV